MALPNMASVLTSFYQTITRKRVTVTTVDFVKQTVTDTAVVSAVVQVADQEAITAANLDTSKSYIQIHVAEGGVNAQPVIKLNDLVEYRQNVSGPLLDYRVVRENNYGEYGYVELIAEEVK
jgi:hypothetical protein